MSDPYIRRLTQKYRLVVAIAVIKEKPQDVSIENYIKDLKNKINDEKIDDLDLTVCSDDFDVDENPEIYTEISILDGKTNNNNNSVTILKDTVTDDDNFQIRKETCENIHTNPNEKLHTPEYFAEIEEASDLKSTYCETQPIQEVHNRNNDIFKSNKVTAPNETQINVPNEANRINTSDIFISNEVTAPNETQINVLNEVNRINTSDHTYYDSQATVLYSLHGYTQNYTHVSQSQNYDEYVINDKLLKAKNNTQPYNTTADYNIIEIGSISNTQIDTDVIPFSQNNDEVNSKHTTKENTVIAFKQNAVTYETSFKTNEHRTPVEITNEHADTSEMNIDDTENPCSLIMNESFPQYAQDLNEIELSENRIYEVVEKSETNGNKCNGNIVINDNDENSNNDSQIVSFKVVEELNKLKNYVNKKIDRRMSNDGSIDSGYRSDSQSKCSFRSSLQLSGNWLNQSAHSLYEYITECPLLGTTHEIIGEISQVLGQLIDKLHEEEKYPSFLDELLENVNTLLQSLFQESGGDDVLIRKDETIQRLLLLNKSVHIQKYSIEKITALLENLLCRLTDTEETYETSNIDEIENISYIFHLLEVILQRYIKGKNILSQDMTNSQLEIKKSSITELWRKKWNPNYKEDNVIQEFTPRKCVLVKCNEILNKLVVTCMDGYSLIAFAALNCFNILQS